MKAFTFSSRYRAALAALLVATGAGLLASCKDYLDVEPLTLSTVGATFSTVSGATSAVLGAYDPLSGDNTYGTRLSMAWTQQLNNANRAGRYPAPRFAGAAGPGRRRRPAGRAGFPACCRHAPGHDPRRGKPAAVAHPAAIGLVHPRPGRIGPHPRRGQGRLPAHPNPTGPARSVFRVEFSKCRSVRAGRPRVRFQRPTRRGRQPGPVF